MVLHQIHFSNLILYYSIRIFNIFMRLNFNFDFSISFLKSVKINVTKRIKLDLCALRKKCYETDLKPINTIYAIQPKFIIF
jgi:hypothetical protein